MSHLGPGTVPWMWRLLTWTLNCLFSTPSAARIVGWEGQGPFGNNRSWMALGLVVTSPACRVLGAAHGRPGPEPVFGCT